MLDISVSADAGKSTAAAFIVGAELAGFSAAALTRSGPASAPSAQH
jgi:hypothetical protein